MKSTPLRSLLFLALFGCAGLAHALNFKWDKNTYIPIGIQLHADTVVRFPEPIDKYWSEEPLKLSIVEVDDTTLAIRTKVDMPEQRLFVIGKKTSTVYLARISTELKYYPLIQVENTHAQADKLTQAAHDTSIMALARSMMRNEPPLGFEIKPSSRTILETPIYRLEARRVWRSSELNGIVAEIIRVAPGNIEFTPQHIQLSIPELGVLRLIAADRLSLPDGIDQTAAYFIFSR